MATIAQSAPAAAPASAQQPTGLFVRIASGQAPSVVTTLAKVGQPQTLTLAPGESVRDRIRARCGLLDLAYVSAFLEENLKDRPGLAAADLELPSMGGDFVFPFCLSAQSVPYSVQRGDSIGKIYSRRSSPLDALGLQKNMSEGEALAAASLGLLDARKALADARAALDYGRGFAATENARRFIAENPGIDPLSLKIGDSINIDTGQRTGFVPLRDGVTEQQARSLLLQAAQRDKAPAAVQRAKPATLIGQVTDLKAGSCDLIPDRAWPFSVAEFKDSLEANARARGAEALERITVLVVDTGYDKRMIGRAIPNESVGAIESFVPPGGMARVGVNTAEQNDDPEAPSGLKSSLHGSEVAATLLGGSWLENERAAIPLPKVAFASLASSNATEGFYLDPNGIGRAYARASQYPSWNAVIINASVSVSPPYENFKNYLKDESVLLITAAGNVPEGQSPHFTSSDLTWPGSMGGNPDLARPGLVISVGAHNPKGEALYFSRQGETQVDLLAPGCRIPTFSYADDDGIRQEERHGTSYAAPIVSLVASLLAAENLSNHAIKNRLITTVDVDGAIAGSAYSSGRLNVARALRVYEDYVAADSVTYADADGGNPREVAGRVEIWGRLVANQDTVRLCNTSIKKGDLRMLARMTRPETPEERKIWRYVPGDTKVDGLLCPSSYPVSGDLKFEIDGGTATVAIKYVHMFAARARNAPVGNQAQP